MSCDSVTVSSIVASLRPPPGVGKGRMHTLFSVSSHQHAKPEPVHGFLPSPPVIGPIRTYPNHRSRSRSAGLECLADLAEKELSTTSLLPSPGTALLCAEPVVDQASTSGSSSEDEESMPPPPPRRLRSNSNPEAMFHPVSSRRPRLLLPDQFLESELAQVRRNARSCSPPSIPEDSQWLETATFESTANDNAMQLLQETRSRLLEDLSQSSLQQRKSATTTSVLPHDLDKYKDVSLYCCLCSKLSLVCVSGAAVLSFLFLTPQFSYVSRSTTRTGVLVSTPWKNDRPFWPASTTSVNDATGIRRFGTTAASRLPIGGYVSRVDSSKQVPCRILRTLKLAFNPRLTNLIDELGDIPLRNGKEPHQQQDWNASLARPNQPTTNTNQEYYYVSHACLFICIQNVSLLYHLLALTLKKLKIETIKFWTLKGFAEVVFSGSNGHRFLLS